MRLKTHRNKWSERARLTISKNERVHYAFGFKTIRHTAIGPFEYGTWRTVPRVLLTVYFGLVQFRYLCQGFHYFLRIDWHGSPVKCLSIWRFKWSAASDGFWLIRLILISMPFRYLLFWQQNHELDRFNVDCLIQNPNEIRTQFKFGKG